VIDLYLARRGVLAANAISRSKDCTTGVEAKQRLLEANMICAFGFAASTA